MFLFFNIIYFFYPLYIMNKEQIFVTRNLKPSDKNYQQQKQNITIKYKTGTPKFVYLKMININVYRKCLFHICEEATHLT